MVAQLQQPETQVIGIVVGTVVVNEYMELINRLKEVIVRAGKKPYEMLVGKLNEPKLRNLAIIDLYVLVSCRETSLIDPREFMTQVLTPHEVFMALTPSRFPWQCKIITDFRQVLRQLEQSASVGEGDNGVDSDVDGVPVMTEEEKEDQLQLVKVEHRDLVPIFTT